MFAGLAGWLRRRTDGRRTHVCGTCGVVEEADGGRRTHVCGTCGVVEEADGGGRRRREVVSSEDMNRGAFVVADNKWAS